MAHKPFHCSYCGKASSRGTGDVNAALKRGDNLYCGRACSGLGRRTGKKKKQLKEEKRLYDVEYRKNNEEMLKAKKKEYFAQTYNPEKAAIDRAKEKIEKPHIEKKRLEYIKTPEYKARKKKYDRPHRLIKKYGSVWGECMALTLEIRDECLSRMSDYEIRKQAGTLNKSNKRKQDYERLNSNKSKIGPLGNLT